ncbi:PREDICTED: CD160 antigen [Elephantulus edwardii]|uniref:CD160 antigen n=1 Tax=Elephantulus edwardii TaxID=28737 RepID=UPI0003F08D8A|nr:PREDICTED: CD160 antigen [Elephantulus edwardii]
MSLTATASTIFRITNFLIALSLGTHRAQFVQRIGCTWPRPFLARPLFLLFFVTQQQYSKRMNSKKQLESEVRNTNRASICFTFLGLLTMCKIWMALGRGCFALVMLLAIVDILPADEDRHLPPLRIQGCKRISSSTSQKGKQLNLTCTVWLKNEEAEGTTVILCKVRKGTICTPKFSLKQLKIKPDLGTDGISERSFDLVFTINEVTMLNNGTYQCAATSQNPESHLLDHFFFILVSETGNYTVQGLKQRQHSEHSHSKSILNSGFWQEKTWEMLAASLVIVQGMSKRTFSKHPKK